MTEPHSDLDRLLRWQESGGTWRVAARRRLTTQEPAGEEVVLSLLTCDGGEEMDVFRSSDPALLAYLHTGESGEAAAL
ncbi:hypothetical protein [Citricoccus nitrophenolicus]|uniref:hypothetical protein n=1 Tax=Citricoccus nitrophenolicus TaxID=863575 RepID=UPI0031E99B94